MSTSNLFVNGFSLLVLSAVFSAIVVQLLHNICRIRTAQYLIQCAIDDTLVEDLSVTSTLNGKRLFRGKQVCLMVNPRGYNGEQGGEEWYSEKLYLTSPKNKVEITILNGGTHYTILVNKRETCGISHTMKCQATLLYQKYTSAG